jgi:hypothetical protein
MVAVYRVMPPSTPNRICDRELLNFNQSGFQAGEIAIVWDSSPSIACRIALT